MIMKSMTIKSKTTTLIELIVKTTLIELIVKTTFIELIVIIASHWKVLIVIDTFGYNVNVL